MTRSSSQRPADFREGGSNLRAGAAVNGGTGDRDRAVSLLRASPFSEARDLLTFPDPALTALRGYPPLRGAPAAEGLRSPPSSFHTPQTSRGGERVMPVALARARQQISEPSHPVGPRGGHDKNRSPFGGADRPLRHRARARPGPEWPPSTSRVTCGTTDTSLAGAASRARRDRRPWFLSEIRAVRRSLQGRRPSLTVRASARRRVRRAATGGRVQEVVALNWLEVRSRMDPRTAGRTRD